MQTKPLRFTTTRSRGPDVVFLRAIAREFRSTIAAPEKWEAWAR